ncbi:MAG: ABC transporter ATP-binding protein/permease [Acholeplasmataceae bacterium]|nr:ABC transporter ATP-binding protein/permease [Acholeplasmataceae bacterium]
MKQIVRYLKPYAWGIAFVFGLVGLRALLDLLLPTILGRLVSEGIGISGTGLSPDASRIYDLAFLMFGITVLSIGVTILGGYFESRISASFARDLREAVYQKISRFSLAEMDHFTTSSLITRSTNDIQQLQTYVNMLMRMIILQPVLAVGAIAFSVSQQPTLSMVLIASVTALVFMLVIIFTIVMPKFSLIQKLVDRLNLVTRENLSGLRVVRAFNTEKQQAKRIDQASFEAMRLNVFVNRITGIMWPVMSLIMGGTSLAIVYLGARYFVGVDGFEPGQLMALMQYAMRAIMSFMFMSMLFILIPRAAISARRVSEVLSMEITITDPDTPEVLPEGMKGEVVFDKVSFQYPNAPEPVLCDISFVARPGMTTALIGSTGSGKSTLINLIPRFYERTSGAITIDGVDIKDMKLSDLFNLLGYVPQKGVLFSGTIKDNVLFGMEESEDSLEKALTISQSKDFVDAYDNKADHDISQGGTNVSGGQRQRLSMARAIAKNPLVYIFDDSFSALDYATDRKLRTMLDQNVKATKLIVAQRISTIRHADQIIVLDNGRIVGKGRHQQLMETCEVYREIAYSQLDKEEL